MIDHGIGCREIAPGIVRIVISHPYPPANVYFLKGNPPALVDSGHPEENSYQFLHKAMQSLDCAPEELGTVIYTHPHRDHLGGGIYLQVPGWIHHRAVKGLANLYEISRHEIELRKERARYIFCSDGAHPFTPADLDRFLRSRTPMRGSIPVLGGLGEGANIQLGEREWSVLETPGHHEHHICLHDPTEGLLLTGDAVIRSSISVGNDTDQYIASLRRLASLNCRLILPGHGAAVESPAETITGLIDLTCRRKELILELLSEEPLSVPRIMSRLFHKVPDHYIAYQAIVAQLVQLLNTLKSEGRVKEREENGRITFHSGAVSGTGQK